MQAITRGVARTISQCELTFIARAPIDYERACAQHDEYGRTLESLGLSVTRLPADDRFPDCCFIEDMAIVLDEAAVITRCAAASRQGEQDAVAAALAAHRRLIKIDAPATIDGGDVVQLGRTLLVGLSGRTNQAAVEAVRTSLAPYGYEVVAVPVHGCLHFKTACTALDDETLLVNPAWIDTAPLRPWRLVPVPPAEPSAADVLRVGDRIVLHAAYPETRRLVEARGHRVTTVDVSEFVKAEGAVTCLSLVFR
jgi:dimethylargininase